MLRNNQKFATARKLRQAGWSYSEINRRLEIQKSTLHGWLKDISLTHKQHLHLRKLWEDGLKKAQLHAAESHRQKTTERMAQAQINAKNIISNVNNSLLYPPLLKLTLAVLYLGEGTKNKSMVCLANSDPQINQAFVTILRKAYMIDESKFRCHLHLRADQNITSTIRFWSKLLQIPPKKFHKTQIDKRTIDKPTRNNYYGVCAIYYYDASIQKELLALGQEFLQSILKGA